MVFVALSLAAASGLDRVHGLPDDEEQERQRGVGSCKLVDPSGVDGLGAEAAQALD
jgi:hypothetical protein